MVVREKQPLRRRLLGEIHKVKSFQVEIGRVLKRRFPIPIDTADPDKTVVDMKGQVDGPPQHTNE